MEKLTAKEISAIIESCRKNDVSRFNGLGITVDFNPKAENLAEPVENLPISQLPPLEKRVEKQEEIFEELLEEAKLANPTLYEQMLQEEFKWPKP